MTLPFSFELFKTGIACFAFGLLYGFVIGVYFTFKALQR